jgi:hypothetical protein
MRTKRLKAKQSQSGKLKTAPCLIGSRWCFRSGDLLARLHYKVIFELALKARLKRLEDVLENRDGQYKVALITYDESKKSEADAIVEWEVENGPVADYQTISITSYEAPAVG